MDFPIEKHIQHVLKKYSLNSLACIAFIASGIAYADNSYQLPISSGYTFTTASSNTVMATGSGKKCTITNLTASMGSDPRLPPRLSNDGEYVILSEHDYIDKNELTSCTNKIKAQSIKSFLFDINKSKGLVLSADIYSATPDGYLAELYDIKTKKDVIQAKGFFDKKMPAKNQLENVFSLTSNGIISKDGKYVSVNGDPDCTGDSYPGVYNLKTRKLVNRNTLGELDGDALDAACKKLFE
ncbi:hypothetical protein PWG14_13650 (plasmid) [Chromobacterium amazonense]|uniref:hypothetical protein n=1 Tax=Chromobacterium amazonense TaxID=1382803 RepID=UPI00237E13CD|nr:hypothetical protein [Chromobacterium amazonense]MDE1713612.1 hypothetical protein [Chromobacterium amazonense]